MDSNWDLHKENVQPLPQGRKVSELGKFLTLKPNSDEIKKREQIRKEFEDQLRCENEDPLAVWYDYINWVEQNYPEGGEEANLKKLIENCISNLFSNGKYHQDERFFRIFLRYTRIVNDALELFNIMSTSNIFTSIAAFYINWANLVEKNLKKAEEIICDGLEKLAQPTVQLELALKEIRLIAAERKEESQEEEEDVRKPFVPLKVEKKKSGRTFAPVERLANYEQNNYKLKNQQETKPISNSQVKIFSDENGDQIKNQHQEIIKKLPTSNNQENLAKAGRWCDNRIKSKSRLDQPVAAKFEIQEDQPKSDEGQQNADDLKSRPPNQTQANAKLKEIKREEKSPRLVIFEKLAPNQFFYCDLKKIYCGGTEYSFEEIRSIRLKLAKKKEKEQSRKERLRKEVEDLKKQVLERDNLFNDVEEMQKKLNLLLEQKSSKTKSNGTNLIKCSSSKSSNTNSNTSSVKKLQPADPIEEQHCTSEKQFKFGNNPSLNSLNKDEIKEKLNNENLGTLNDDEFERKDGNSFLNVQNNIQNDIENSVNQQQQQINPFLNRADHLKNFNKEDLTIVRDLWNGTLNEDENTVDIEKEIIQKPKTGDFSIFTDDDDLNKDKNLITFKQQTNQTNDVQATNFQEETNTFSLPHGDFDFVAKHSSTPATYMRYQQQTADSHLSTNDNFTLDENCTINNYQGRENKFLSPIVETSKEYNPSSSSSLSGFSSYHKSRTFHK